MAFVVKSERPCLSPTIDNRPGPGHYELDQKFQIEPNMTPFLTSQKRTLYSQNPTLDNPGPGTYVAPVSIQGYNTHSKTFYSALNPTMESAEETKPSNVFKSTTERFPHPKDTDLPGPGEYNQKNKITQSVFAKTSTSFKNQTKGKEGMNHSVKPPVPSIPSIIHAYGYTELPSNL